MNTRTTHTTTHESLAQGEFPYMVPQSVFRKPGVFLVQIGERYALIDAAGEQVVLLNQSGAWLWSRLGTDTDAGQFGDFLNQLAALGLLGASPAEPCTETSPTTAEPPEVLGVAPLQVAANNSGDPFSGTGW